MARPIVLPNGVQIRAVPGKYSVTPPPNLNQVADKRFLLEYNFPHLLVKEIAVPSGVDEELGESILQTGNWQRAHPNAGGSVGGSLEGFWLDDHHQFVPDVSYIDAQTWSHLSHDEKNNNAYLPCVPTVVIQVMKPVETIEELQGRVAKYVEAGTREAVVVDTRRDRVWIHNRNKQPNCNVLAPIEFNSWPDFALDYVALRDTRMRLG